MTVEVVRLWTRAPAIRPEDFTLPDGHVAMTHEDPCPDSMLCSICSGRLFICARCLGFERSLTTMCPGKPLDRDQAWLIRRGHLDYRLSGWVASARSNNAPEQASSS